MDPNKIRSEIQLKALKSHLDFNGFSTLELCTRFGKSRVAVLRARQIVDKNPQAKIFLSVPTTKLRDSNWKNEFEKWESLDIWENNIVKSCYVSMQKFQDYDFDLIILDECHHLTEANIDFFKNNNISSILGLTATVPKDSFKKDFINIIAPISYTYSLEQGVKDGIITPFEIHVIFTELNSIEKNIKSGNAKRRFYVTEQDKYSYLQKKFENAKNDYFNQKRKLEQSNDPYNAHEQHVLKSLHKKYETIIFERSGFIYNLKSKTEAAKQVIVKLHKDHLRYLVFCGSIEQANILCGDNVYHGGVNDNAFNDFDQGKINFLGCVAKLNEGITINSNYPVDYGIAVQINSQEINLIQRIGRIIAMREGHVSKFYIIVCKDTQDQRWFEKASESFDISSVYLHEFQEFLLT